MSIANLQVLSKDVSRKKYVPQIGWLGENGPNALKVESVPHCGGFGEAFHNFLQGEPSQTLFTISYHILPYHVI